MVLRGSAKNKSAGRNLDLFARGRENKKMRTRDKKGPLDQEIKVVIEN